MDEKENSAPKFVDMTSPEDNQRNFGVSIEDYMEEERLYDAKLLEKIEDIKLALQYYMSENERLKHEVEYYKDAYENRVDEFLNRDRFE